MTNTRRALLSGALVLLSEAAAAHGRGWTPTAATTIASNELGPFTVFFTISYTYTQYSRNVVALVGHLLLTFVPCT